MIVKSNRPAANTLTADQMARVPWTTVAQMLQHKHVQLFGLHSCAGGAKMRVFINGEQWPMWRLYEHKLEDIAEMHYIDCLDRITPNLRKSLIVNLKPGIPP